MKAGDVVKVKVLEVDAARKRIALTMRLDDEAGATKGNRPSENERSEFRQSKHSERRNRKPQRNDRAPTNSAMADAFAKLKR